MKGFNLSEWALGHRALMVYLMLVCAVAGGWAYATAGRDEDPPFTIKTMVVETLWPGATTHETIDEVTDRIEKKLEELPALDYLQSYTTPGTSVIFVTLKDSTPPGDVPELWYQTRKKVGDIAYTLPQGVEGPFFNDEFGDTFGVIYGFTADGYSFRELKDYVETVRAALLRLPDVGKITLVGTQDEQVVLEFDPRRLANLGLSQNDVIASLQAQNAVTSSGVMTGRDEEVLVRVSGGFKSEADIAALNLRAGGRFFRLGDIATVRRGPIDPPQPAFRVNGKPAIGLTLSMAKGGNNLRLGEAIHRRMAELERDRPVGIEATLVADQPAVVAASVHGFVKALVEAVVIVLAVSFLSLGLRAGTVVALSIPLVLGATFVGMKMAGIDLQRVSLGALIIALGLLVDDAMITVEMMIRKLEDGFTLHRAATFAYTSTAFPMLTGTIITVIGFVPVGFAASASGEYCFSLFAVMAIALGISWFVAVLFAPLIGTAILPKTKAPGGERPAARWVATSFRRTLLVCLRYRWVTIAATVALFVLALAGAGRLEQQFFPTSERPELLMDITLPQSASIYATERAVELAEKRIAADPRVASFSFYVGQGAVRFYLPMDLQLAHDYYAQGVVVARDPAQRDALAADLQRQISAELSGVLVRVSPLELGPPVGWPIKYRVSGPDPEKVRQAALALGSVVASDPATRTVNYNWNEPIKTVRLAVDQDKARLLGISSQELAQAMQGLFSGTTFTQLRDATYLVAVQMRATPTDRLDLESLRHLQLSLGPGRSVPLGEVASLQYGLEQPIIWRRDRLPTLTVQADMAEGVQAATVVQRLAPAVQRFAASLPAGYRVAVGGTVEESAKGQASVNAVMPVMVLLMLSVLMVQLQSFQRLILVISVAPLGLIGVVGAMLPSHTPMGFVATLGCIALIGMIVRNSVILIDQIEHDMAEGMARGRAVVEATCHRMRPILLTASAAILGMVPIASEAFWRPLAIAIMGGLVVATLLTLLFLPAAYLTWFRTGLPRDGLGGSD